MDGESFEELVATALDELPAEFARLLENLEVQIERRPTPEHRRSVNLRSWQTLYGLYQGVPLTMRVGGDPLLPDIITIFQEPLEHDFPNRELLRAQVRRTILHEIAHFFGISDDRLHELDAY